MLCLGLRGSFADGAGEGRKEMEDVRSWQVWESLILTQKLLTCICFCYIVGVEELMVPAGMAIHDLVSDLDF